MHKHSETVTGERSYCPTSLACIPGTTGTLLRMLRGRRMRTDAEGHVGIQLEHRQIRKSAAAAIASNLRRLGPRVLPMSEMVRPHTRLCTFRLFTECALPAVLKLHLYVMRFTKLLALW